MDQLSKTPFFETYMGRNAFQSIFFNFQVSDSLLDLPLNYPCSWFFGQSKIFHTHVGQNFYLELTKKST